MIRFFKGQNISLLIEYIEEMVRIYPPYFEWFPD